MALLIPRKLPDGIQSPIGVIDFSYTGSIIALLYNETSDDISCTNEILSFYLLLVRITVIPDEEICACPNLVPKKEDDAAYDIQLLNDITIAPGTTVSFDIDLPNDEDVFGIFGRSSINSMGVICKPHMVKFHKTTVSLYNAGTEDVYFPATAKVAQLAKIRDNNLTFYKQEIPCIAETRMYECPTNLLCFPKWDSSCAKHLYNIFSMFGKDFGQWVHVSSFGHRATSRGANGFGSTGMCATTRFSDTSV